MVKEIYKDAVTEIVVTEIRKWVDNKIKRAKINAYAGVMTSRIEFSTDGQFLDWRCPVILHGHAEIGLPKSEFADIVVTGSIIGGVQIFGCQFLDREGAITGNYNDKQKAGRFRELYEKNKNPRVESIRKAD